jgi:hypothetical protein
MTSATPRNQLKAKNRARGRAKRVLAPAALFAAACVALALAVRYLPPRLGLTQTRAAGSAPPSPAVQPDPPGIIDGSKTPDLIPDEAAYRVVFIAFAEPANATDAQKTRFRAKLCPAGLRKDDEQALFSILSAFKKHTDDLHAQAAVILARNPFPHPDSTDYQQLLDLDRQARADFHEAMVALPARLSAAGVAKLDAYVKSQKRGMKYLPDMAPPPR